MLQDTMIPSRQGTGQMVFSSNLEDLGRRGLSEFDIDLSSIHFDCEVLTTGWQPRLAWHFSCRGRPPQQEHYCEYIRLALALKGQREHRRHGGLEQGRDLHIAKYRRQNWRALGRRRSKWVGSRGLREV